MNLANRGIDGGQITHGDGFHDNRHPGLKGDHILTNPPFSVSDWGGERLQDDQRWVCGIPPKGNANFAWAYHLATSGTAGFVPVNGSMSSNQSGEGEIRKMPAEADCMVAPPGQLFYSIQIPACLWFLSRDRVRSHRRRGKIPFVDARKMGRMLDPTCRELTGDDISKMSGAYGAWRGDRKAGRYADAPRFCKSVKPEKNRRRSHVLVPDRRVGAKPQPGDGEPLEEKMSQSAAHQAGASRSNAAITINMENLMFPVRDCKA